MLKNTLLNTSSSIVYFFLQWVTTVLAVRFSSFETAGIFALAISFTNIFYYIALFGIRNFQISDVTNTYSAGKYMAARIVAAFLAMLGFLIMAWLTNLTCYVFWCYFVYMIFKLCEAYTEGYFSVLQKRDRYNYLAFSYFIKGVAATLAFSCTLWFTHDLLVAIIAMTAGYLAVIFTVDVFQIRQLDFKCQFVLDGWNKILYHCIPLLLMSLSVPVMNYITRFAIEQTYNAYYVGQYASLSSVIVVMSTFAGAIFVVFIPQVSTWSSNGEWHQISKLIRKTMVLLAALGVLAMIVGKLLGPSVCALIFGADILESIDLLVPLLFTSTLLMIKSFFSALLVSFGRRKQLLVGECGGAALCLVSAIPLTNIYGMQGTNLSYALGVAIQILLLGGCTLAIIKKTEAKRKI